jgi:hypothetical protein
VTSSSKRQFNKKNKEKDEKNEFTIFNDLFTNFPHLNGGLNIRQIYQTQGAGGFGPHMSGAFNYSKSLRFPGGESISLCPFSAAGDKKEREN